MFEQELRKAKQVVRPPGFGPGLTAWKADVLNQARLRPLRGGLRTNILNLLINLQAQGLAESTLKELSARIKFLDNHVDLDNSQAVNTFISDLKVSPAYKHNLVKAYAYYIRAYDLE